MGNLFWLNLTNNNDLMEVPVCFKRVQTLVGHYFNKPTHLPVDTVVAVSPASVLKIQPPLSGKLERISPVEFTYAFLLAVQRDIEAGDKTVIEGWRNAMLCTSFLFKIVDGDGSKYFSSQQLRQDVGANYVGCRQTAIAKIYDVVKFKNRKQRAGQTLNAEEIAKAYRENVQYAKVDGGENDNPASKTFVSEALSVHNRLLKLTRVQSVLLAADDDPTFQNPLDSVGKLYIVASKAKEPHLIEWAVAQLLDLVQSRAISVDQLGDRALAG